MGGVWEVFGRCLGGVWEVLGGVWEVLSLIFCRKFLEILMIKPNDFFVSCIPPPREMWF